MVRSKKAISGWDLLFDIAEAWAPDVALTFRGYWPIVPLVAPTTTPPIIYHYTGHSGLIGILTDRNLWATHVRFLNDATEYTFAIEAATAMLTKRRRRGAKAERKLLGGVLESLKDTALGDVYVVCFSTHGDRLSQWRGYCPAGIGYSLGFASPFLTTLATNAGFEFRRCVYSEEDQQKILGRIVEALVRRAAYSSSTEAEPEFPRQFACTLITTLATIFKHPSFEEEAEWRLVKTMSGQQIGHVLFRAGRSTLVPYVRLPLVPDGETRVQLQEIIVGPNPLPELAMNGVQRLLQRHAVKATTFRSSSSPYRSW